MTAGHLAAFLFARYPLALLAVPASLAVSDSGSHGCRSTGQPSGRPGPLKIESADPPVAIEYLPDQMQTGHQPRLHGAEVDFFERNSPGRHLGKIPSSITQDRKLKPDESRQETISNAAWHLRAGLLRIARHIETERLGASLGKYFH